jgi:pimeloyl-ACP methyl ester carboxylesterase
VSTPRRLDLPAGVCPARVRTTRGEVATLQAGPRDGRLVLLVPGWTGSKEDYLALLPLLADRGLRAVAFDQRGQFESPGPDEESAYALDELAADALALAETLAGTPVHLVGHSFGGLVVTQAAVLRPHRVATVTLVCSGPGALPAGQHDDLRMVVTTLQEQGLEAAWQQMRRIERESGATMPSAEIEQFLHKRFLAGSAAGFQAFTRHLLTAADRTVDLACRPVPLLVMAGELDDAWPLPAQAGIAERAGGRYTVVPGAAHSPAVEDPDATAAVLGEFLERWTPPLVLLDEPVGSGTSEVPRLRRLAKAGAAAAGLPAELVEDVELAVSELVTNALLHGTQPARLCLRLRPGPAPVLDVEVVDAGNGAHHGSLGGRRPVRPHHGRGRQIIHALAPRHGSYVDEGGVHVWAQLTAQLVPA